MTRSVTAVVVVWLVVLVAAPTAQKLPGDRVGPRQAKVYRDVPAPGRGDWKVERVDVTSDGLVVGQQQIPYSQITEAIYDRRKGGFRGMLRKPETRHVLTVRFTDDSGRRQFLVIELGKDIAELTANRLESLGGIDVTLTDS